MRYLHSSDCSNRRDFRPPQRTLFAARAIVLAFAAGTIIVVPAPKTHKRLCVCKYSQHRCNATGAWFSREQPVGVSGRTLTNQSYAPISVRFHWPTLACTRLIHSLISLLSTRCRQPVGQSFIDTQSNGRLLNGPASNRSQVDCLAS